MKKRRGPTLLSMQLLQNFGLDYNVKVLFNAFLYFFIDLRRMTILLLLLFRCSLYSYLPKEASLLPSVISLFLSSVCLQSVSLSFSLFTLCEYSSHVGGSCWWYLYVQIEVFPMELRNTTRFLLHFVYFVVLYETLNSWKCTELYLIESCKKIANWRVKLVG